MSGGHFNFNQSRIRDTAEELKIIIEEQNSKEIKDYSDATLSEFAIGLIYLKLAYIYAQRIDYLLEGDDSEDSFHRRLDEELCGCLKNEN